MEKSKIPDSSRHSGLHFGNPHFVRKKSSDDESHSLNPFSIIRVLVTIAMN